MQRSLELGLPKQDFLNARVQFQGIVHIAASSKRLRASAKIRSVARDLVLKTSVRPSVNPMSVEKRNYTCNLP